MMPSAQHVLLARVCAEIECLTLDLAETVQILVTAETDLANTLKLLQLSEAVRSAGSDRPGY